MNIQAHNPLRNLRTLLLNGLVVILTLFMVQACGDDDDDDGPTGPNGEGNIVEVAQSNDDFSELVSYLEQAGLVSTLEGDGPFTVFAPTNNAFGNIPQEVLESLSDEQLTEILSYHVIDSEIASGDLESEQSVEALAGGSLFVTVNGDTVLVNDYSSVVTADIEASNGIIHAVDQVLLPDAYIDITAVIGKRYQLQTLEDALVQAELVSTLEGDTENGYTVFAPSNTAFEGVDLSGLSQQELQDILTYHVLPQQVLSGDIESGSVETVNGATIDIEVDGDGNVTLTDQAGNTSSVTTADLQGSNGVVHIIDGVLSPSQ